MLASASTTSSIVTFLTAPTGVQKAVFWFCVGAIIVVFHAIARFDTPTPPPRRSTTTFSWYYFGAIIYAGIFLFFYGIVATVLGRDTLRALAASGIPEAYEGLAWPLYAALGITVFLSSFPLVSRFDIWLRETLQETVGVPVTSEGLGRKLQQDAAATFDAPRSWMASQQQQLIDDIVMIVRREERSPLRSFMSAAHLLERMDACDKQRMRAFVRRSRTTFDLLRKRHEQVLQLLEPLFVPRQAHPQIGPGLKALIEAVHRDTAELAAQAVLYSCRSGRECEKILNLLGYRWTPDPEERDSAVFWQRLANGLTLAFLGIALILFIGLLVLPQFVARDAAPDSLPRPMKLTMIILSICTSVLIAITMKRLPRASWSGPPEQRPHFAYFASALAAGFIGVFWMCIFRLYDPSSIPRTLYTKWGWTIFLGVLAYTVAFLADDRVERNERAGRLQLEEAIRAMVTAIGGMLLTQACLAVASESAPELKWSLIQILIAGTIGGVIGWFVPTAYRHARGDGASSARGRPRKPDRDPHHPGSSGGAAAAAGIGGGGIGMGDHKHGPALDPDK